MGTGLSSWAVYRSLSKSHPEASITLIDAGKRFTKKKTNDLQNAEKDKFGSIHMYETSGSGISFKKRSNYSLAHGGLSTVWGAGIRLWSEKSLELIPLEIGSIYEQARELLLGIPYSGDGESLNFPPGYLIDANPLPPGSILFSAIKSENSNSGVNAYRPALAVSTKDQDACRGCGECLKGCPYNSIFDSGLEFDDIIDNGQIQHIIGIVESVTEHENKVMVTYKVDGSLLQNQNEFDEVYLCAGAIGTPAILMRSGYLPNEIRVADSQAFYFIGLKIPKLDLNQRFALAQANLVSEGKSPTQFSASLYLSNEQVRARISKLISTKLFGMRIRIPKLVDRFLFLGIGFLDSEDSGYIILNSYKSGSISASPVRNPNSKKTVSQAMKNISKRLRRSGLIVIPKLSILPEPGAGFHSGAALALGEKYTDGNGLLRGYEHIHVADVSLLPCIKAGSHTFTSMAVNAAVIKASIK